MTNHTPGPWETYANSRQGYQLGIRAAAGQLEGGYEIIAEVIDPNHFPDGVPEAEATARLIAAAPDLLAALESLLSTVADEHDRLAADPGEPACGPDNCAVCQARAAIAKVKGGAPCN